MKNDAIWTKEITKIIESFFSDKLIPEKEIIEYFSCLLICVCKNYEIKNHDFKKLTEEMKHIYLKEEEANAE